MISNGKQQRWFHRLGLKAETLGSRIESRLKQRLRPDQAIHIIAYRGIGNERSATLNGRVLAYHAVDADEHDGRWNNLCAAYARFDTDELAGVTVVGQLANESCQAVSDEEGYFSLSFKNDEALHNDMHSNQAHGAAYGRFHGVLAPNSRYRERITPTRSVKVKETTTDEEADGREELDQTAVKRKGMCPQIMEGKACIKGTRVTVGMIVGQIRSGRTIENVLEDFPYLEREDILEALQYSS